MKRIITTVLAITIMLMMSMTVFASNDSPGHGGGGGSSETVPAPTQPEITDIGKLPVMMLRSPSRIVIAEDGSYRTLMELTPLNTQAEKPAEEEIEKQKEKIAGAYGMDVTELEELYYFEMSAYKEHIPTGKTEKLNRPGTVTLKLSDGSLGGFVSLLSYKNGTWNVVPSVQVIDNSTICFTDTQFDKFVILTSKGNKAPAAAGGKITSPKTGDTMVHPWIIGLIASMAGATFCIIRARKIKEER